MIPHKVLNIRCYICTYLALFFIFVFIRLLEYQILQFHAFILYNRPQRSLWAQNRLIYGTTLLPKLRNADTTITMLFCILKVQKPHSGLTENLITLQFDLHENNNF